MLGETPFPPNHAITFPEMNKWVEKRQLGGFTDLFGGHFFGRGMLWDPAPFFPDLCRTQPNSAAWDQSLADSHMTHLSSSPLSYNSPGSSFSSPLPGAFLRMRIQEDGSQRKCLIHQFLLWFLLFPIPQKCRRSDPRSSLFALVSLSNLAESHTWLKLTLSHTLPWNGSPLSLCTRI